MRQLLTGPFTDGEIPDDLFVSFVVGGKDHAGYVLSYSAEKGGTPGVTGSGTAVVLSAITGWNDQDSGLAFFRFADGDLDLDSDAVVPVWYMIQLWADKTSTPVRRTATIGIGFFVEPSVGDGGP